VATWGEIKRNDERTLRRKAQDAHLVERHRNFDLSAQDNHMKYERAHFAVVGEGTRTAQENYRAGWERIFSA
jgi:hypothetical protein